MKHKSEAFMKHEGHPKGGGKANIAKHSHEMGSKDGHIPHAGHGLHPDHKMLHEDAFHKNEHHG